VQCKQTRPRKDKCQSWGRKKKYQRHKKVRPHQSLRDRRSWALCWTAVASMLSLRQTFMYNKKCVDFYLRTELPSTPPVIGDHTGQCILPCKLRERKNQTQTHWSTGKWVTSWVRQENKPWHRESPLKYDTIYCFFCLSHGLGDDRYKREKKLQKLEVWKYKWMRTYQ